MHKQPAPTVVVIGDINADLSLTLPSFPREGADTQVLGLQWGSGGTGLNMAVGLARLGARARLVGRVGSDPAAEVALRAARRSGVDLTLLQVDPELATGLCSVMVSPGGERSFLSFRGANPYYDPATIDRAVLHQSELLLISGYGLLSGPQRSTALRAGELAASLGVPCALDLCLPAIGAARALINDLMPRLWLLTLNSDELQALLPGQDMHSALDALLAAGVQTVALKRGGRGCSAAQGSTRIDSLPPVVSAIDTNACGDAFTAAFAWALLHGSRLADCAALGNLLGALTATRPGAAEAIPERHELLSRADPAIRHLII